MEHGPEYGELTVDDLLEQGARGLRGREALDAALVARSYGRLLWRARSTHPLRLVSAVRRRLPSGRPSSRRRGSASRGSPTRPSSDPDDLAERQRA